MKILVTGAGGLIGSEAVVYHATKGDEVLGLDVDMRGKMFGKEGSVSNTLDTLKKYPNFKNYKKDIRNRKGMEAFFKKHGPFSAIWHCAAQPAHDFAASNPYLDHDINCEGTFNLLESFRKYSSDGVFLHFSTSKIYGANPNNASLIELPTRYDYAAEQTMPGISELGIEENFPIDNTIHSLFGASKAAGDLAAQEYGKYFGLKIGIFRGDCLTGKNSMGVPLHGFLSFLVQSAVNKTPYTVIGYDGKQCRGQIHGKDVIGAGIEFINNPKHGETYNLGGGKENSISMIEAINMLESKYDLKLNWSYQEKPRIGDHICFYSNIAKLKRDFPNFKITMPIDKIMNDLVEGKTNGVKA